ncbi:hypothetical protein HDF16_006028 [Granulicella aggregans]|uniref:Uncharacterized protein n=1 Tax=Granulicella aggregans TaxID=474949 RepID=A0A7W8E731_9BACT|nr:hypothetical protein [Granulicella aggregans]
MNFPNEVGTCEPTRSNCVERMLMSCTKSFSSLASDSIGSKTSSLGLSSIFQIFISTGILTFRQWNGWISAT